MSIKHAILALLDIEKGSGYDLRTRFQSSIGCFWSASHQQIYKELATLSEAGWLAYEEIEQKGKPAKKIYQVTDSGREELKRWVQLPAKSMNVKSPFLIKVFAGKHLTSEQLLNDLNENTGYHRDTLNAYEQLEQWFLSLPENSFEKYKLPYATLKLGIKLERAWLEWGEELIESL